MTNTKVIRHLSLFILLFSFFAGHGQTQADSTQFAEVRSLVNFYEYMLNTIGSASSSTRDKEVIITESYKKIFVNPEVQIEDDLVLDRKVITNKDVAAYLRDVDFFFNDLRFDFENIEVQKIEKEEGGFYFLVSFENSLKGNTLEGEAYSTIKKRFIEVNLNEETKSLKIASIYSTKVSREKELQSWWSSLSYGWINIFKEYVPYDTINNAVLFKMAAIDSLNLSGNQYILNLEPLAALKNLKVLDISHTQLLDISPLRYARNLRKLKASNTPMENVAALQYFEKLVSLDLSQTSVTDITAMERLGKLISLDLSNTPIIAFEPLSGLTTLESINLSGTNFSNPSLLTKNKNLSTTNLSRSAVVDLIALKELKQLRQLDLSETAISSLKGLEELTNLETLTINGTQVNLLVPVMNCPKLKKVEADFTGITEKMASNFMVKKPNTVVVTNSAQIMDWWSALSPSWKLIFSEALGKPNPTKEDIVKLMNLDSLNLAGKNLYNLEPLKKFRRMRYLDVSKNLFTSFEFTEDMVDLEYLNGSGLPVTNTYGLEKNNRLKFLILKGSLLEDISSLSSLNKLELLDADNAPLDERQVINHLKINPKTVIIYQSQNLLDWWENLSEEWKEALNQSINDSYHLHKLIEQRELSISNQSISSLEPLSAFVNLETVNLDRLRVTHLNELYRHTNLRQLSCTNGPLQSLDGIKKLRQLETLDISNTAIEDLKDLYGVTSLRQLNCSGTGIKNLRGIEGLSDLQRLNVSNTRIWKLDRLSEMKGLQFLICNNTRLRAHTVEEFQALSHNCEVTFY
jgi:uncharacterized protein YjbI with pentapeptide repeats